MSREQWWWTAAGVERLNNDVDEVSNTPGCRPLLSAKSMVFQQALINTTGRTHPFTATSGTFQQRDSGVGACRVSASIISTMFAEHFCFGSVREVCPPSLPDHHLSTHF